MPPPTAPLLAAGAALGIGSGTYASSSSDNSASAAACLLAAAAAASAAVGGWAGGGFGKCTAPPPLSALRISVCIASESTRRSSQMDSIRSSLACTD